MPLWIPSEIPSAIPIGNFWISQSIVWEISKGTAREFHWKLPKEFPKNIEKQLLKNIIALEIFKLMIYRVKISEKAACESRKKSPKDSQKKNIRVYNDVSEWILEELSV